MELLLAIESEMQEVLEDSVVQNLLELFTEKDWDEYNFHKEEGLNWKIRAFPLDVKATMKLSLTQVSFILCALLLTEFEVRSKEMRLISHLINVSTRSAATTAN